MNPSDHDSQEVCGTAPPGPATSTQRGHRWRAPIGARLFFYVDGPAGVVYVERPYISGHRSRPVSICFTITRGRGRPHAILSYRDSTCAQAPARAHHVLGRKNRCLRCPRPFMSQRLSVSLSAATASSMPVRLFVGHRCAKHRCPIGAQIVDFCRFSMTGQALRCFAHRFPLMRSRKGVCAWRP